MNQDLLLAQRPTEAPRHCDVRTDAELDALDAVGAGGAHRRRRAAGGKGKGKHGRGRRPRASASSAANIDELPAEADAVASDDEMLAALLEHGAGARSPSSADDAEVDSD